MRHKKKHQPRPKKRTTFLKLFMKSGIIALIITAVFSAFFHQGLLLSLWWGVEDQNNNLDDGLTRQIDRIENKYDDVYSQIEYTQTLYATAEIWLFGRYDIDLNSESSGRCHALSVIIDEDNNIVSSSRKRLGATIKFDGRAEGYFCDKEALNFPQVDELYSLYDEMSGKAKGSRAWVEMSCQSAYVDRENHVFIPHEGIMTVVRQIKRNSIEDVENIETREINIDIDDDRYELIEFAPKDKIEDSAHIAMAGFRGTDTDFYDEYVDKYLFEPCDIEEGAGFYYLDDNTTYVHYQKSRIRINGERYMLYTAVTLDESEPLIMTAYLICCGIFLLIALFAAFLWSLIRNIKNKAQYAFEDYQRTLINNLAHDMKTPLTAIGGYAENAIKSLEKGNSEDAAKYLAAINENVFYTDSIVERTLELNKTTGKTDIKKETLELCKMAENALDKYALMLEEKDITVSVSGEFTLSADMGSMTAAVENLVSNAVKFTPEHGKIDITADKNSLTFTNDIAEDIDTADLTLPFIKGGRTADHPTGSGLGLAIVSAAADSNGLKMELSCAKKKFTVKLKN